MLSLFLIFGFADTFDNKFEEKSRWARLGKAEHNLYFAEFCRGLKQSSYLSLEAGGHE